MNNNLISCKCVCKCLKRGMKARRDNWEEGTYIGLNTNNIIEFYKDNIYCGINLGIITRMSLQGFIRVFQNTNNWHLV